MRRSRLILPSFVALSLMAGAATAQQGTSMPSNQPPPTMASPPPPPHEMGMAKDLNLSPQQKEQVRQIFEEQRQETHEKLSKVLTPEQMEKWDAHMQAHRPPGGPHSHPMMPAKPGQPTPPPPAAAASTH